MTPLHIYYYTGNFEYTIYIFSRSIILMASVQTCNMLLVLDMTLKSNIIYDIDHST